MLGTEPRTGLEVAFRASKEAPRGGEGRRGAVPPSKGFLSAQAAATERAGSTGIGVAIAPARRWLSQHSNSSVGIGRE